MHRRREQKAARRRVRLNARRPGSAAHKRDAMRGRAAVTTPEQIETFLVSAIQREAGRLNRRRKVIEAGAAVMQRMVPGERA